MLQASRCWLIQIAALLHQSLSPVLPYLRIPLIGSYLDLLSPFSYEEPSNLVEWINVRR